MHIIDFVIFIAYLFVMLGVGFFFMRRNKDTDDYYVGGRGMNSLHIGLSVVATDVGGGFAIGLGGLGFAMGLSGSWMLLTGLVGAWLSAVLLIPKIYPMAKRLNFLTFPQVFKELYSPGVALLAGIISAIGYMGFTSSQVLAGAKLVSATFIEINLQSALWIMGSVAVVYTVLGGLKAVIYTDTVQWIVLMVGLIFVGLPLGYYAVGGWESIKATLPSTHFDLNQLSWQEVVKWTVTIIPIWFVGMTLYQRIYACKDEKTARRAWFFAGLFEWPIMAFMGVALGLLGRVAAEQGLFIELGYADVAAMDSEMGLPLLLRAVLPVGLMGVMLSAYFSAIMSTADSCLMAASGNLLTDIVGFFRTISEKRQLRLSQLFTFVIGLLAILIASTMKDVLELMLYSYAFMVSGLFVPVIAGLYLKRPSPNAALAAMLLGGSTTLSLILLKQMEYITLPYDLDENTFGLSASLLIFLLVNRFDKQKKASVIDPSLQQNPEYREESGS